VRPFSFVMEWEGKLTFATSSAKNVYNQIKNNPEVEICSFDSSTGKWTRISGNVSLFQNVNANKKIFEVMPMLRDLYKSEDNPELVCFYFEKGVAAIYDFSSANEPTKIISL